ncbi:hypothetical protein Tco_0324208 [Tanacetum coccineum]
MRISLTHMNANKLLMSVQTILQASLLKEKKGVRFSSLYLQKKRNLLVFDHSHQQSSYFPMPVQLSRRSTLMASEQFSSRPRPHLLTLRTLCSGLVPNSPSPTPYVPPTKKDWDILFQLMFDEYFNPPPIVASPVPIVVAPEPADSTVTYLDNDPFFVVPIPELNFEESSSRDAILTNIEAMQEELHEFDQIEVWEHVSRPDHVMNLKVDLQGEIRRTGRYFEKEG